MKRVKFQAHFLQLGITVLTFPLYRLCNLEKFRALFLYNYALQNGRCIKAMSCRARNEERTRLSSPCFANHQYVAKWLTVPSLYSSASHFHLRKMDSIQNRALRHVLGANKTSLLQQWNQNQTYHLCGFVENIAVSSRPGSTKKISLNFYLIRFCGTLPQKKTSACKISQ